jgi:hypothetical protein
MARSKVLILDDVIFAYLLIGLLNILNIIKIELSLLPISGFVIASFLIYVEPIDLLFRKIIVHNIENIGGKPKFIFEKSFEHSCLDYTRIRLRTTVYILISLCLIFLAVSIIWIKLISFLVDMMIVYRLFKDLDELSFRICAIAGYIAKVGGSSGALELREFEERKLESIRHSLEEGDWLEALRALVVVGIPTNVYIPEKFLKRAMELK